MSEPEYDGNHTYAQTTPQELATRIESSTDAEELRNLARSARPSLLSEERQLIAGNPHCPSDLLHQLLREEEDVVKAHDPQDRETVPDPILNVLQVAASNPAAHADVLRECLRLALSWHHYIVGVVLSHPNLPQREAEDVLTNPTGLATALGTYEWNEVFQRRGDPRSILITKMLGAGRDPRAVVGDVDAVMSE